MSFTLVAPVPLTETTTVLPNPAFGDSEAATGEINILRTVTGGRRTYIKTKTPGFPTDTVGTRRRLSWTFRLTRNKALELLEFYRSYNAQVIFIRDHNERTWVGYIVNNPFEIEMDRRGNPSIQGWPAGELCTTTVEFEGARTSYDATAAKNHERFAITDVEPAQAVRIDMQLPVQNSVIHNWDANTLADAAHGDGAAVTVWPDSAGTNDLIAKIGSPFDPAINRIPLFLQHSNIFTGLPTVSFVNITGQISTVPSAMITTSDTALFPNKRGTVFWVWAHTNDAIHTTDVEFGLWGLQHNTLDDKVEQVRVAGASNQLFPMNARFRPVDVADDLRLATTSQGAIPTAQPTIYMVSRDSNTNLRFRTNGIERTGKTILDNPGYSGKFHLNNQAYIPEFDATLTGEFGQFLVFNKALKEDEISNMERYLSLRWGIELGQVSF